MSEPTLEETGAVLAAVETFHRKLHPRQKRNVRDLPRLLAETAEAIERVRSVTRSGAQDGQSGPE